MRLKSGVAVMEYALLVCVLVLAIAALQVLLRRALNYRWKEAIDSTLGTDGRQYESGRTTITVNR